MPRKSCVVIGAGLAGLSAAYALVQRGWNVTVFEAQDRLGGRVLSHSFEGRRYSKLVCELGAEWIGNSHDRVRALCRAFDLKTQPHRYSATFWTTRTPGKKLYGPEQATLPPAPERRYEKFLKTFRNATLRDRRQYDNYDWWTILKRLGLSEAQLRQRELEDGTDFGESIRMTSGYVAASEYAYSSDSDELDLKIEGGNVRLAKAYAREIRAHGGGIHLSSPVREIHQTRAGVTLVYFDGGRRLLETADLCICAVPATRLRHFKWSPQPDEHLDAAEQLQYSRITKTAVLFNERFWPTRRKRKKGKLETTGFAVFTNRVADFCFDSTYGVERRGAGVLCSYSFGEKAANISSENEQKLAAWIRDDVLEVQGKKRRSEGIQKAYQVKAYPWHEDEWAGGAYAFYRPGQWFAIRPLLQRPFGRVLFAGEHLADESGFMESAVRSGEAVARAV